MVLLGMLSIHILKQILKKIFVLAEKVLQKRSYRTESCSKRMYKGGRVEASAEAQILCFLWFSGNKTSYRKVGNIFGMSLSNVHKCFNNVLKFLVYTMVPKIITFPLSEEEKETIANNFEKISGIPNILG